MDLQRAEALFHLLCEPSIREWSEREWCASWYCGNEHELWWHVEQDLKGPWYLVCQEGGEVTLSTFEVLRLFVEVTGYWYHDYPPKLVPLEEWKQLHAKWAADREVGRSR